MDFSVSTPIISFAVPTVQPLLVGVQNEVVSFTVPNSLPAVGFSVNGAKPLSVSIPFGGGYSTPYEGAYTVTPSLQTQTLQTYGKTMLDNVTINPIPSNYGLITWDGSHLTVS